MQLCFLPKCTGKKTNSGCGDLKNKDQASCAVWGEKEEEGEKESSQAESHLTCLCCSSLTAKPAPQTAWNRRAKQPVNHGAGGPCRGELVLLRTRLLPLHLCGLQGQVLCRPSQ